MCVTIPHFLNVVYTVALYCHVYSFAISFYNQHFTPILQQLWNFTFYTSLFWDAKHPTAPNFVAFPPHTIPPLPALLLISTPPCYTMIYFVVSFFLHFPSVPQQLSHFIAPRLPSLNPVSHFSLDALWTVAPHCISQCLPFFILLHSAMYVYKLTSIVSIYASIFWSTDQIAVPFLFELSHM